MLSPHASVRDIHQAYETLRMSYLPIKRDRSIPVSPETTEQLQKLDRAFRLALDSKNPNAPPTQKVASKTSTKAANKTSTKSAPRTSTTDKDPFHSVVQDWAKTSTQNPSPTTTGSTANTQSGSSSPNTGNTQNTNSTKKTKSATGDTQSSKKAGSGYWLLFIFVVCGIGGYLFGSDSTPSSSNSSRNNGSVPAPRAAPNNIPAQVPPPQYSPAPTGPDPFVVALQQELNRRGFNAGAVDGLIGPQTFSAITAAQSAFNMSTDGVPSEALLRASLCPILLSYL